LARSMRTRLTSTLSSAMPSDVAGTPGRRSFTSMPSWVPAWETKLMSWTGGPRSRASIPWRSARACRYPWVSLPIWDSISVFASMRRSLAAMARETPVLARKRMKSAMAPSAAVTITRSRGESLAKNASAEAQSLRIASMAIPSPPAPGRPRR